MVHTISLWMEHNRYYASKLGTFTVLHSYATRSDCNQQIVDCCFLSDGLLTAERLATYQLLYLPTDPEPGEPERYWKDHQTLIEFIPDIAFCRITTLCLVLDRSIVRPLS